MFVGYTESVLEGNGTPDVAAEVDDRSRTLSLRQQLRALYHC